MPGEKFDINLIPKILRPRRRELDAMTYRKMRLPKGLQKTRLRDLKPPVDKAARDIVRVLDTLVGPLARIYIFHGGAHGQHTTLAAGLMQLAHMFGFLTMWTDLAEMRSYESPMVDEERTLYSSAFEVDVLVVDCSSTQDLVGNRVNTTDFRRILRKRILENRTTIVNLSGAIDEFLPDETRKFKDLFMHSASRVLLLDADTGNLGSISNW